VSAGQGRWLGAALLLALVLVVFAPVRHHDFVAYDDFEFVVDNTHVQQGLTADSVRWAFSREGAYVATGGPVTWLSHMLDVQLFGMTPGPAHVVNVALHAVNTLLLFFVLAQMTGAVIRSACVAALFAVHPLHVESVAWIAERKDVLSLTFWLLTTSAYVRYVQRPGAVRYVTMLTLFAVGLLAKPVVAVLPFTLLLLDAWPLARAPIAWANRRRWVPLVIEKLPMFALAVGAMSLTFISQKDLGALAGGTTLAWTMRASNAVVSYVSYLLKMLWPSGLAVFYPYPASIPATTVITCALVMAVLTIVAWWRARTQPYLLIGWLWYVGTLIPMIGLVQVGSHAMADRFTYVPLIGIFIGIIWGVAASIGSPAGRRAAVALAGVAILSCAVVARAQVDTWRNSETLWRHAMAVTTGNFRAYAGLAEVEASRGAIDAAIADYQEVVRLAPDNAQWQVNLGLLYAQQDRVADAADAFARALQLTPNDPKVHTNLGVMLARQGRWPEAVRHYERSIALSPNYALAHRNLGLALATTGDVAGGLREGLEALRLVPGEAQWHYEVAVMLLAQNRTNDAIDHLQQALRLQPQHQAARDMLSKLGR
jgi:protein O-mannosyl-transferase